MGGLVAFEMAAQLLAQNQELAQVVLIDTASPNPWAEDVEESDTSLLANFANDLGVSWKNLSLPVENLLRLKADEQLAFILSYAKQQNLLSPEIELSHIRRLWGVFKGHARAQRSYTPKNNVGRIILFRAREPAALNIEDSTLGWEGLTVEGVEVHLVPGDHYTMMDEPHVRVLARRLGECLGRADLNDYSSKQLADEGSSYAGSDFNQ